MTFFILNMWYSLFYTNIDCRNKNCLCLTSTHWKRRSDAFLWINFCAVFHQFGGLTVLERHLSREFMYIILLGSIQMWQSDLSGGWEKGSSHIYSSGNFPWLIYNESAFLSSNTIWGDWFPFYRSIISLPETGKKKRFSRKYHSFANTWAYWRTACGSEISSWKVVGIII